MKTIYYTLLLYVASTYVVHGAEKNEPKWGPIAGNVQMSVRLKDGGSEIKTNQPVDLVVRIRNLSTNETAILTKWVGAEAFPPTWSQPVISQSANEPGFGLLKDGSFSGSISLATVPPKGSYEFQFHLGILSQCRTNDAYTIVAQRMVGTNFMVTSNPLCLRVTPGEWKDPNP